MITATKQIKYKIEGECRLYTNKELNNINDSLKHWNCSQEQKECVSNLIEQFERLKFSNDEACKNVWKWSNEYNKLKEQLTNTHVQELTGNVYERENYIDVDELEYITEVDNGKEKLSSILDNYIGEKVKITIEKI